MRKGWLRSSLCENLPFVHAEVGHGWYMGGPGLERVWNGMERGLERNGPLQHSSATTKRIFIKIGSVERE